VQEGMQQRGVSAVITKPPDLLRGVTVFVFVTVWYGLRRIRR
jgi:uncharacterized membrane-anchored protein